MKTELLPFTAEMIPDAGRLLAERHRCNRESIPLLPTRFEEAEVATKAVETLWQEKYKDGYAAFRRHADVVLAQPSLGMDWSRRAKKVLRSVTPIGSARIS
jgi:hypothetical protein